MPSSRQLKTILTALVIFVLVLLYASRDTTTQKFYTRTVAALDKKEASDLQAASKLRTVKEPASEHGHAGIVDGAQKPLVTGGHVDESRPGPAKGTVDEKGDEADDDSKRNVAGRRKLKETGDKAPYAQEEKEDDTQKKPPKTKEEEQVDDELNSILKRGPIIVFSKSWCPYSAKAKRILLENYNIVPQPHVVELDQHPLGSQLQGALEKTTGRRTVPNVLINGKSIGGGDDIEALETSGTLAEKVKALGGKRIVEVTKV